MGRGVVPAIRESTDSNEVFQDCIDPLIRTSRAADCPATAVLSYQFPPVPHNPPVPYKRATLFQQRTELFRVGESLELAQDPTKKVKKVSLGALYRGVANSPIKGNAGSENP
jgi:hypothetical protein